MVASEVQQQQHQHDEHNYQQPSGHPAQQRKPCWLIRACQYAKANPLELANGILESITLVLVVFVQDIAFKQAMAICAALLTASFILHGLAFRAGQCQVSISSNLWSVVQSTTSLCHRPTTCVAVQGPLQHDWR